MIFIPPKADPNRIAARRAYRNGKNNNNREVVTHAAGVLPLQPPLHEALLDLKLLQQCLHATLHLYDDIDSW